MNHAGAPIRRWSFAPYWLLLVGICITCATPSSAHESLPTEIAQATRAIGDDPENPRLYLHRAELFRLHRHWHAALDDYARAETLAPGLAEVVLGRASLQLDTGHARAGLATLEALAPQHATGKLWALKSRAHEMCSEYAAALNAQERYLAATSNVRPEDVLRRARLGMTAGETPQVVLRRLDAGIARVGPAPALQQLAIELELRLHNYDRALDRLTALEPNGKRAAAALARRGDILVCADRALEARVAYTQALDHLESLGPDRRGVPANQALEQRLRSLLSRPFPIREAHAND